MAVAQQVAGHSARMPFLGQGLPAGALCGPVDGEAVYAQGVGKEDLNTPLLEKNWGAVG